MKNSFIILFLCLFVTLSFDANSQVVLVKDTWTTNAYGGILTTAEFIVYDGKLFFAANDGGNRELWVSDGTESGTNVFKEINPSSSSSPDNFYTDGNLLFFSASDGSSGSEPFVSDGTEAGTFQLKNINPSGSSSPFGFIHFNGEVYFSASTSSGRRSTDATSTSGGRSSTNNELWKTDGTSAGTVLVKEINTFSGSNPTEFVVYNNKLYFVADDGTNGEELWSTDGTEGGTTLVTDIHPSDDADISELTVFDNKLYFSANDGTNGDELWSSDGTAAGTTLVKDISTSSSAPYGFTVYNNTLFFAANDGTNGYELWKTNGTEAGTVMVKDINPSGTGSPQNLYVGPNAIYFTAEDGVHNKELWKSDGTEAGTVLVKDIRSGSSQSNPSGYITYNGKVYFIANDGNHGTELWATDGTSAGTVLVEDIWNQNTQSSIPLNFVVYNHTLLFSATNSTVGRELYKYNSQVTWDGSTSTDWDIASNWDTGSVPTSSDNVLIFTSSNTPSKSGAIDVNNLTINSDAGLTVTGNITANDITIESGGSLIAQGTVTATFTQKKNISSTDWHVISIPVSGETVEDLRDNHSFATGSGSNVGIGTYLGNGWSYYTSSSSGTLTSGHGIAVKLTEAQDISFTGSMETDNVSRSMLVASNDMNLLGNPYPSYLPANTNADATNNILTINSGVLTEQTLWFWNAETSSYDQVNQATEERFIKPGEGFFVSTSANSNLFSFTELMQNHKPAEEEDPGGGGGGGGGGLDDRTQNAARPEIQLHLKNDIEARKTDIFYIEGTTTGFDNGYDSTIFIGSDEFFQIYTHHVANGNGEKLGIQSLPNDNFETTIIPIGIKASSGTEITISATTSNLPNGVYAYLEDKEDNSFTVLDTSSDFKTTLSTDLNGIGRFYLHTYSTLGVSDQLLSDQVSIYQTNEETLRIVGIQEGKAQISIYNILGKHLIQEQFDGHGTNDILLPKLSTGLYIVRLETEQGSTSKKIVIN